MDDSEATYVGVAMIDVIVVVTIEPPASPGALPNVSGYNSNEGRKGQRAYLTQR